MTYHYSDEFNQSIGPVSAEKLHALFAAGIITMDTQVIPEGATSWQPYRSMFPTGAPLPVVGHGRAFNPAVPPQIPWYKRRLLHAFLFFMMPYIEVPLMWIFGVFKVPTRIILTPIGCLLSLAYFVTPLIMPQIADSATAQLEEPANSEASNSPASMQRTAMPPVDGAVQQSDSEITWDEINSIYNLNSGKTEFQKNEAWKRFKGKRVLWTGIISEVSETFGVIQLSVKMNSNTLTSDVQVYLKRSEREKAARIKEDDRVRFTGILKDWGTIMDVTVSDGEILND